MPRLRNAKACCAAARKALEWLNPHFEKRDEWAAQAHPLVTYHKVPQLFAVAGRVEECSRALTWIKANLATPEGDLLSSPTSEGRPPASARVREKAWVALAACISGRYDLALPIAAFLAKQQGAATGGVYDRSPDRYRANANVRTTACAGLVFLAAGMTREARSAGRFLTTVMERQPDDKRFFTRLDNQGKLVLSFPKSEARLYALARARGRTEISLLGVPAVFLAKLHRATGEEKWLESAMDYYAFAEQYGVQACTGDDGGAFGWSAAALYGITRRRFYYDMAEQAAQAWVDRQKADGSWLPRSNELPAAIAMTAEAALCLIESIREAQ